MTTTRKTAAPTRPRLAGSVLDLVGGTPLVRLNRIPKPGGAVVLAKMESLNPGGSVKDRIALSMIEEAERRGLLKAGATIVEPTSGNTGIGLAMVCAVRGYRLILTMPDDMSVERQRLLARYGAEIHLTPAIEGMTGAVFAAQEICREHPDYFMPLQFENPANPEAHRRTTAQEILDATEEFDAQSEDPLYNRKVQTFDFRGMVAQFDQALAQSPGLTSWALTNALLQFHLSGSDDEALGGDLAYWYGKNAGFTGFGLQSAQQVIGASGFGSDAQTLRPFNGLQEGFVKLA